MDIQQIKDRIAAMIAKSEDKAATESEAMAAIAMAQKLMDKYGVTVDDLENDATIEAGIYSYDSNDGKAYLHEVDSMLIMPIAKFCDARPWRTGGIVSFAGLESDIELAMFIRNRLKATMEFEWKIYRKYVHEGKITTGVRRSFMRGFADRISARLKEVKAESVHYDRDKTQLIVLKEGLIETVMRDNNISLGNGRKARAGKHDAGAYEMGGHAGKKADIGRGMGGNRNAGLLR